jgi:predicted Rossmann fold flavoprotein
MSNEFDFDVVVVGGGAGGYFTAIACAEANPSLRVGLLEGTRRSLTKVQISGGGRCNVTHDCLDPNRLVQFYPRGGKELRQVFARFHVQHTIEWFESRGVALKAEADGRMFSITNRSQTIIDCLQKAAQDAKVQIQYGQIVSRILALEGGGFSLATQKENVIRTQKLVLATGSAPGGYTLAADLGLAIIPPVPSLFTFQVEDPRIHERAGVSVPEVEATLSIGGKKFQQRGPILFTHWGLSGPCVLKLSAWAARELHDVDYHAPLSVNWLAGMKETELKAQFMEQRQSARKKTLAQLCPFPVPKRLWEFLLYGVDSDIAWGNLSTAAEKMLIERLLRCVFLICGKGVFKEEFVSCGGVDLRGIDFRSMETRTVKGLYVVGELLNIDGVTGGFNFQNAWSTGWIAGRHLASCF